MEKVGFIGTYDKTNLILYTAKLMTEYGKKVIIVDTTTNQRLKYVVPTINPTKSYITEFEGIDVAVGLYSFDEINSYLGINSIDEDYDYALIDIDDPSMIDNFDINNDNKNYFVTGFDTYTLKRGLEILSGLKEPLKLKKILYSEYMFKEDDDYLNYLSLGMKIVWDEDRIYFPLVIHNETIMIENQRLYKIKVNEISNEYKQALNYLTCEILKEKDSSKISRIMKQL